MLLFRILLQLYPKTFKDIIVKDKVDIVIIQFCTDMLLARDSVLTLHP